MLFGQALNFRHINQAFIGVDTVMHHIKPFAGQIDLGAMTQVAAGGKVHAEDGIAGLQQRQKHTQVRR